jgi:hypothetical protein
MNGNGKFLGAIKMLWGTDYYCFTHMEIHSPEIRRRKIGVDSLDHHSRENSEVVGIYPDTPHRSHCVGYLLVCEVRDPDVACETGQT